MLSGRWDRFELIIRLRVIFIIGEEKAQCWTGNKRNEDLARGAETGGMGV